MARYRITLHLFQLLIRPQHRGQQTIIFRCQHRHIRIVAAAHAERVLLLPEANR